MVAGLSLSFVLRIQSRNNRLSSPIRFVDPPMFVISENGPTRAPRGKDDAANWSTAGISRLPGIAASNRERLLYDVTIDTLRDYQDRCRRETLQEKARTGLVRGQRRLLGRVGV